ncbi:MAG TPA: protein kinase, partial [Pirellulales bacterium]|nr:protein kinase [Pirellulales bacterium]
MRGAELEFRRAYLVRLPLPLAQLYCRAHNAKDARGRHDNAFYLFEATIKLAAAGAVACYLQEVASGARPRVPALDRQLAQLALPSLGQWVGILRELSRHFGERVDAPTHALGHLWSQLSRRRTDLPDMLALYCAIKNGADGAAARDETCSVISLFDALVQYRNGVFGHGAARFDAFYEQQMGPLLFPAINELLAEGVLDLIGPSASRLVYLTEKRTLDDGRVQLAFRELVGMQGERTAPLELSEQQAAGLLPGRMAVLWPGYNVPLRLDPLLQYRESELAEEVLFLNRDRNGRHVEYLSYTTGRTERDKSMLPALAALLSQVANRPIGEADLERLAEQSLSETPPVEALLGEAPPVQQVGDYELLAELGRGGMGVVYLARQRSLGRLLALKMLPSSLSADTVALARFQREIRCLARCDHPNIVKVLGSGTLPDGRIFYAMEYVPGCDLEQVWRELAGLFREAEAGSLSRGTWSEAVLAASRKQRDRTEVSHSGSSGDGDAPIVPRLPLPPLPQLPSIAEDPGGYVRRVVAIVRDTALALQAVHDQGFVHRDIKPA